MIYLLAMSMVAAMFVGYLGNGRIFIAATIGVLATSLILFAQDNGALAYLAKVILVVTVFELTAVCAMLYFSTGLLRAARSRRK